jgi:hypothetical protein
MSLNDKTGHDIGMVEGHNLQKVFREELSSFAAELLTSVKTRLGYDRL